MDQHRNDNPPGLGWASGESFREILEPPPQEAASFSILHKDGNGLTTWMPCQRAQSEGNSAHSSQRERPLKKTEHCLFTFSNF